MKVLRVADKPLEIEQLDSEDDDTIILEHRPPSENSRSTPQTPARRIGAINRYFRTPVQPPSTIRTVHIRTPGPTQTPRPVQTQSGHQVRPRDIYEGIASTNEDIGSTDRQIYALIATEYDTETKPTSFQEAVEDPKYSK